MTETIADPPLPSCHPLFPRFGIEEYQLLDPDPLLPRAQARAKRSSGNPGGRPRGMPDPRRRNRSCGPAAGRAGAVGSARPQTASVAAPRRATLAAADRCHRPGGASRDRPGVTADGRGCSTSAVDGLAAVARGDIAPDEAAHIAERAEVRLCAARRVARLMRRPAHQTNSVRTPLG